MRLLYVVICLFVHHVTLSVTQQKNDKDDLYYAYYNYEDEYGDRNATAVQVPTNSSEEAVVKTATTSDHIEPGFRAQVACSSQLMAIVIDRTGLPLGLGFADTVLEDRTKDNFGSASCVRATHNSTHYAYKVDMRCESAVGVSREQQKTIYTHEFLMDDVRTRKSGEQGNPYSIIMDCAISTETRSRGVMKDADWTAMYRVFEHRVGRLCAADCPHGELCLPEADLDGFFCSCTVLNFGCDCPEDFYGCSGGQNETTRSLVCIRNDVLCDSRHDCPLRDDEECSDIFDAWSHWSKCSSSCGDGTQTRQRNCQTTFNTEPQRSRKPCSRGPDTEVQSRHCDLGSCSSVECGTNTMRIEIPMELGMTGDSVQERMHLRDVKKSHLCRPQLNGTHVTFVIPLHDCNTSTWIDGDGVFYSNVVVYEVETEESAIIVREYGHSYTAKCQYKRRHTILLGRTTDDVSGKNEVAALKFERNRPGDLHGESNALDMITHYSSGDGVFEYRMDIYADSSFTTRYTREDYPLEKRLGQRLYIAVNFNSQDEDLNVFIERCWAMSSGESGASYDDASYLFINGGCPVDPTVQFHPDGTNRFSDRYSIEAFKFNDVQYSFIYFRCDVIVCDTGDDDPACERNCLPNVPAKRRKRDVSAKTHARSRVTQGPVVIFEEWGSRVKPRKWSSEFSIGSVEHEIITLEDERRNKAPNRNVAGGSQSGMRSPYLLAAIAGSVCLTVGLSLGLLLRRKNTATTLQTPKVDKNRLNAYIKDASPHDEATAAIIEGKC